MAKPYDSIFKEIFERVVPVLAPLLLHVPWGNPKEIKDKTQVTEEREADYLKIIEYKDAGSAIIFHAEFHVKPEDLRNWMFFKRGMLRYRHNLPVHQVVFYIGDSLPSELPNELKELNLDFRYDVIYLKGISYEVFLNSMVPEVVLLSILGNFGQEASEQVIPKILQKLQQTAYDERKLGQLLNQLEVLSNLRKLQPVTVKFIEAMPIVYDLESDIRFKQGEVKGITIGLDQGIKKGLDEGIKKGLDEGIKKGLEKQAEVFVTNLLLSGNFTDEQIANFGNITVGFVTKIKKKLDAKAAKAKKPTPPKTAKKTNGHSK